jgi:hypothetical protein
MDNITEYLRFHRESSAANDIDPQNDCLSYISDRYELNTEQRYWLAFLFGTCYCAPTVFYIYNEFPDYQTVDVGRLQRWWTANREKLVFQTDRARVRSNNEFVNCFKSYKAVVGNNQEAFFKRLQHVSSVETYKNSLKALDSLHYFGRFTMFIYLEMVSVLTNTKMTPHTLDLRNAESCRNGLALALGRQDIFTHFNDKALTNENYADLEKGFLRILEAVQYEPIRHQDIFNIETTLCAYKKVKLGKRYVGFYIERMRKEIETMERNVPRGVDWSVLYQFRNKNYHPKFLKEKK